MTSIGPGGARIAIAQASLIDFYDRLDGRAEGDPVSLFAPDAQIVMELVSHRVQGGPPELREFLDSMTQARLDAEQDPTREPMDLIHEVATRTRQHNVETVVGAIRRGGVVRGTFLAAAQIDNRGLLCRYVTVFAPILLVPHLPSIDTD